MKKKFKVPYGLKKLALGAAVVALPVFTSCEKDKDPIQERIEQLTALEKVQAAEVRAAVEPAKTVEGNITNFFNSEFDYAVQKLNKGLPRNILDSAYVFEELVTYVRGYVGDPLPVNNATMTALFNKSKSYIATAEELNALVKNR